MAVRLAVNSLRYRSDDNSRLNGICFFIHKCKQSVINFSTNYELLHWKIQHRRFNAFQTVEHFLYLAATVCTVQVGDSELLSLCIISIMVVMMLVLMVTAMVMMLVVMLMFMVMPLRRYKFHIRLNFSGSLVHPANHFFTYIAMDLQLFHREIQHRRLDALQLAESIFYFSAAVSAVKIIYIEHFFHKVSPFI